MDTFYKDDILGIAYAVGDVALSYGNQSVKHNHTAGQEIEETKAINLAYTLGGLTLGFQDAKTKNSDGLQVQTTIQERLVLKQRFNNFL